MQTYDVVIVGAGPYGLSVAAHLKELGLSLRLFGTPMQTWREHMPSGMLLKSDGFASNLSDPRAALTLAHFCRAEGMPYDDRRIPVHLDTFVAYGEAFQKRFLPELDTRNVTRIDRAPGGAFVVEVAGEERVAARRVVLAVGISHFAYMPPELADLPPDLVSHASAHRSLERFRGEEVTILGGGASAIDVAALLQEAGANVCVLTRRSALEFHRPPTPRPPSLRERLRRPSSGLGPGWPSWVYSNAPQLFRHLPSKRRLSIVRTHLGPAGGWAMRGRFEGKIAVTAGLRGLTGTREGNRIRLALTTTTGSKSHQTSHLIAATGYRPNLAHVRFLSQELRDRVRVQAGSPTLSPDFESSVPGLYFVGLAAANSFGPLMRFAFGATYTARRLAGHMRHAARPGGQCVQVPAPIHAEAGR